MLLTGTCYYVWFRALAKAQFWRTWLAETFCRVVLE